MSGLVMTADQVAAELEYLRPGGTGRGDTIREMYREGDFPPPIDPDQPVVRWRWSRAVVERYVAGEWPWQTSPSDPRFVYIPEDGAA